MSIKLEKKQRVNDIINKQRDNSEIEMQTDLIVEHIRGGLKKNEVKNTMKDDIVEERPVLKKLNKSVLSSCNNILLMNESHNENIMMLNKILLFIENNNENVNSSVKCIIDMVNKSDYKKYILENPNSIFSKFSFSKSLSREDENGKIQIYIIDYDYIKEECPEVLLNIEKKMKNSNAIFIYLTCDRIDMNDFIEKRNGIITLHKLSNNNSYEKQFYNGMIKACEDSYTWRDWMNIIDEQNKELISIYKNKIKKIKI